MAYMRRITRTIAIFLAVVAAPAVLAVAATPSLTPAIVPRPASLAAAPGEFRIRAGTAIVVPAGDDEMRRVADHLKQLAAARGVRLAVATAAPRDGAINLLRDAGADTQTGAEGYRLEVGPKRITIAARGAAGLRYGAVSLWQLMEKRGTDVRVPALTIRDAPRFAWRGLMLDSARHFQSPEFIRHYIDWMAVHKLNVLHWHLTDDQAWRIEIKKYPELTRVGAWRVPAGDEPRRDIDPATGKPRLYGGFYTQDTVRAIVAYAAERGITVVPEIEMPGHATAAAVAYPRLAAASSLPREVPADWGIYPNVYNLDDATFTLLEDVLTEVMALFPSKYIHVGGDEVEKGQWKDSPSVQARMKELGIAEYPALQAWFTQRIGRFLDSHGRRLVGWDEVLEPGLPSSSVIMSWRGIDGALNAAAKGYDTILSPWPTLYFDNRQGTGNDEPPGRPRLISLETVYGFEPMPDKLTAAQRKHVLGLQANLWSEHIRTEERMASMTFPRAAAVAELGWSPAEGREYRDFVRRLAALVPGYRALGLPYSDSAFAVHADTTYTDDGKRARVALSNQAGFGDLRYTLNGAAPGATSPRYTAPFTVAAGRTLRAAAFSGRDLLSRPRDFPLDPRHAQRRKSQELKLCSEDIALGLEDDAPLDGPRAVFMVDVQSPCWIFSGARLDGVSGIEARVGQLPFNFQIGDLAKKIVFPEPQTADGELLVHLDDCKGEVIARLPLKPAAASNAVTTLPFASLAPRTGRHDLCLRFAQKFDPARDSFWVLDSIELAGRR